VVWFEDAEASAIAEYLGVSDTEFRWSYARWEAGRWTLEEVKRNGQYDCVFLKRDTKTGKAGCSIYPVRPAQCRTWPFWDSNLRSPRDWQRSMSKCPGMKPPDQPGNNFVPVSQIRVLLDSNPNGL
jgi:hypothetical protein